MKQLLIILIFACVGCSKEEQNKFFDPENISSLNLETINTFWGNDNIKDTSYYMGAHFENYSGYIKGIRLSGDKSAIWVSVFDSQDNAIDAMQLRINDVACVIREGNSDAVNGKWWYSECSGTNIVIVNQWNAIIEVDYNHPDFGEIENFLYSTANEIAERVDQLSSIKE
jgi:hypothetical protein